MSGNLVNPLTRSGWATGFTPLVEDLSFNYQQTLGSPEPDTLIMFGSGILGLAGLARRKFNI